MTKNKLIYTLLLFAVIYYISSCFTTCSGQGISFTEGWEQEPQSGLVIHYNGDMIYESLEVFNNYKLLGGFDKDSCLFVVDSLLLIENLFELLRYQIDNYRE